MVSGAIIEKPILTAFKANGGEYVVLDNEMNGTMGLPIILVSKLVAGKLVKIVDQNEWGAVKEVLRNIISGNQVDYIPVEQSISADDNFFSQLTLPVASFDALKNAYQVGDTNGVVNPVGTTPNVSTPSPEVAPEVVNPTPVETVSPVMPEPQPTPVMPSPVAPEVVPEVNNQPVMETPAPPVSEIPRVDVAPTPEVVPVMPNIPTDNQTTAEVIPQVEAPQVEPIPEVIPTEDVPVDFTADKEAFLKACENMFDALVTKFNNKG